MTSSLSPFSHCRRTTRIRWNHLNVCVPKSPKSSGSYRLSPSDLSRPRPTRPNAFLTFNSRQRCSSRSGYPIPAARRSCKRRERVVGHQDRDRRQQLPRSQCRTNPHQPRAKHRRGAHVAVSFSDCHVTVYQYTFNFSCFAPLTTLAKTLLISTSRPLTWLTERTLSVPPQGYLERYSVPRKLLLLSAAYQHLHPRRKVCEPRLPGSVLTMYNDGARLPGQQVQGTNRHGL